MRDQQLSLASALDQALQSWMTSATLSGEIHQESSLAVYEHMWSGFREWSVAHRRGLAHITPQALSDFLDARARDTALSDRYAWRMLHLIHRVAAHRAAMLGHRPNLSVLELLAQRPELRFANAANNDVLPEFLTAAEATRLVNYLGAVRPGRGAEARNWRDVRNRASVGLMLGAGLTPGETRVLHLGDVVDQGGRRADVPWKLRVAGNGNAPARETPIANWAGHLLKWWMAVRRESAIPGHMLFPSTSATGKPWGKVAQYNAARQVLTAAGMDATEGGSFKLRHTFALRQLRSGKSPEDVAGWLGVSNPAVMARYQRIITGPVDLD